MWVDNSNMCSGPGRRLPGPFIQVRARDACQIPCEYLGFGSQTLLYILSLQLDGEPRQIEIQAEERASHQHKCGNQQLAKNRAC